MKFYLVLMLIAIILLVLSSVGLTTPWVSLGWFGLACWCLATLVKNPQ